MAITLCSVVRNEAPNIQKYLGRTFRLFDAVAITDTGSRDGTRPLLKSEYGIEPSIFKVSFKNYFSVLDAKNFNIRSAGTSYIFMLDADEFITGETLQKARAAIEKHPAADGFFFEWNTYKNDSSVIRDYKLNLFKNDPDIRLLGDRHPNVTISIRDKKGYAVWVDAEIEHHPEQSLETQKKSRYLSHLYELTRSEPEYFRYHWFLGMTLYSIGEKSKAMPFLAACADSRSRRFPVECLNSSLLLTEVLHSLKRRAEALAAVESALTFYESVKTDFEVKVNFRLLPALGKMRDDILNNRSRLAFYSFGGV